MATGCRLHTTRNGRHFVAKIRLMCTRGDAMPGRPCRGPGQPGAAAADYSGEWRPGWGGERGRERGGKSRAALGLGARLLPPRLLPPLPFKRAAGKQTGRLDGVDHIDGQHLSDVVLEAVKVCIRRD